MLVPVLERCAEYAPAPSRLSSAASRDAGGNGNAPTEAKAAARGRSFQVPIIFTLTGG